MYYIIELQTNIDGTGAHLVQTDTDRNSAEAKYHGVLQFAAVSNVYKHSATIIDEEGVSVMHQCYVHEPPIIEDETPEENGEGNGNE